MQKLVSVIIPVYNSQHFVEECIQSIQRQTYNNIEIIIIDDGSTDASSNICDKIAECDSRVKVFHIPNGGVAQARNYGLQMAQGEYIAFADSDDLYIDDFLEKAVGLMCEVDYFSGAFLTFSDSGQEQTIDYLESEEQIISIQTYIGQMVCYQAGAYWGANWGKLYRRDIIDKYNIKFEDGVQFAEDFRFNLEYLLHVKKIALSHSTVYKYRIDTENSLSKKRRDYNRYWSEYYELFERYRQLSIAHIITNIDAKIYAFLVRAILEVVKTGIYNGDLSMKEAIILAREMGKASEVQKAKNFEKEMSLRDKLLTRLLLRNSRWFLILALYIKKLIR